MPVRANYTLTATLIGRGAHRYTSSLSQSVESLLLFHIASETQANLGILIKSQ
jgi:hypothetical protein